MELQDYMIRLGAALLAGVLIGFEREWRLRSAGLLTNTLVAVGACIYIMASDIISADAVNADPSRVLGQIVAGIGFLGAGVIMRDGVNIHGLNSAATIWLPWEPWRDFTCYKKPLSLPESLLRLIYAYVPLPGLLAKCRQVRNSSKTDVY